MEPILTLTVGGENFPLETPSVQEVRDVKRWTGFASKQEWYAALIREDGDALLASYVIAKRRRGEHAEYGDATDFPADIVAKFTDGAGREVEPVLERNDDGSTRLDERGNAIPVLDEDGVRQWRDVESGVVVPFAATTPTTTTTSGSSPERSSSGDTGTGTPTIVAV